MAQEKIRLLIIEDNAEEIKEFAEYVDSVEDVELLGSSGSSREGLALVLELSPDGIILDLELTEGDGLDFLIRLGELSDLKRPYVVVTTNTTSQVTLQALRDNGAGFILVKTIRGYSCKQVVDKFRMVRKYLRNPPSPETAEPAVTGSNREAVIRRHLSEDLEQLGIPPNLNGHDYIIEAVLLMIADPKRNFDVSRSVYPVIGKKYQKFPANVERSIRSAIETAWTNMSPAALSRVYTAAIRPNKGRPMNKELICFFARKYR